MQQSSGFVWKQQMISFFSGVLYKLCFQTCNKYILSTSWIEGLSPVTHSLQIFHPIIWLRLVESYFEICRRMYSSVWTLAKKEVELVKQPRQPQKLQHSLTTTTKNTVAKQKRPIPRSRNQKEKPRKSIPRRATNTSKVFSTSEGFEHRDLTKSIFITRRRTRNRPANAGKG